VKSAEGAGPDPNVVYALGRNAPESARRQRQADELAADSVALLDRVALQAGQCANDLGCGPRGILDLLADRVTPGGQVVGLDADPVHAAMAGDFVDGQKLSGVEIITGDARHTGLPQTRSTWCTPARC
jgi:trans-aconitate methyltransferase